MLWVADPRIILTESRPSILVCWIDFIFCNRGKCLAHPPPRPSPVWRCNFISGFLLRCLVLWSSLVFRCCCFPGGSMWQAESRFPLVLKLQLLCSSHFFILAISILEKLIWYWFLFLNILLLCCPFNQSDK